VFDEDSAAARVAAYWITAFAGMRSWDALDSIQPERSVGPVEHWPMSAGF
jgi:hypothetical protein